VFFQSKLVSLYVIGGQASSYAVHLVYVCAPDPLFNHGEGRPFVRDGVSGVRTEDGGDGRVDRREGTKVIPTYVYF